MGYVSSPIYLLTLVIGQCSRYISRTKSSLASSSPRGAKRRRWSVSISNASDSQSAISGNRSRASFDAAAAIVLEAAGINRAGVRFQRDLHPLIEGEQSGGFVEYAADAGSLKGRRGAAAEKDRFHGTVGPCLRLGIVARLPEQHDAFENRILPFDSDAARVYASIAAARRAAGRAFSQADGQIMAIARSRGMTVATRNVRDFEDMGGNVINPWQGS